MLMKMGYKPGQGIGKTESGRTEPIPVEVKGDRQGLGKTLKKRDSHKRGNPTAKLDNIDTKDFRNRLAQEKAEQLQKADLYKSQKVCRELDTKGNIEKPEESWFWPESKEEKEADDTDDDDDDDDTDDEDDDQDLSDLEKLEILTRYLRKKYFYCIWCGMEFNDEDDLRDECPGGTRSDH